MTSIMDDMRAAADEVAEQSTPVETPEAAAEQAQPVEQETPAQAAQRERDEAGRFAKKTEEKAAEAKAKPTEKEGQEQAADKPAEQAQPVAAYKPPQSWKPEVRQEFAKLPPAVQAEIARVDGEVRKVMQESATAKRTASAYEQAIAPYRHLLTDEPPRVVANLMQTAAVLQTGAPQDRAGLVAHLIHNFKVSPDAVADALEALQKGQPVQQPTRPPEYRDPRVDRMLAEQEAQQQRHVESTLAAFVATQPEFFEDVRLRMAALVDDAHARGETMTLEQAYDAACWADPSIRKVLSQREAESRTKATADKAATQRARAAASSVRTEPAGGMASQGGGGSIADDMRAARASLSGR